MALESSQIIEQFQKVLGRGPTQSEIDDFTRFQKLGIDVSAEDIGRIIQGLPEQREKQLTRFGDIFSQQLATQDERILGKAQNSLQQQFALQGRQISGSAYVNAFAQAAQNLAAQRQQQVAGFIGGGLQDIFGSTAERAFGGQDIARNRLFEVENYQTQKSDFDAYQRQLRNQRKKGFLGGIGGALVGGALGAPFGLAGPGAQLGGGLGQGFGTLF